jgi:chromatin remodeling complex protein RSC6
MSNQEIINILEDFTQIQNSLSLFKMNITTIQTQIKDLEKKIKKEIKVLEKNQKTNTIKKSPSGFAKPTSISKELCDFLNYPEGSKLARTQVTKELVKYIKSNNLLKQTNNSKQVIYPDEKLNKLLGKPEHEELNYFNIQKYMTKHFSDYNKNKLNDEQTNEFDKNNENNLCEIIES